MDALEKNMPSHYTYGNADPAAVDEMLKRIREAGKRESLLTYSELVKGITFNFPNINEGKPYQIHTWEWTGLDRKIVGDLLACASSKTYRRHGFLCNALVVTSRDPMRPGWQFFEWMKDLNAIDNLEEDTINTFWVEHVKKAYEYYTGRRRNP